MDIDIVRSTPWPCTTICTSTSSVHGVRCLPGSVSRLRLRLRLRLPKPNTAKHSKERQSISQPQHLSTSSQSLNSTQSNHYNSIIPLLCHQDLPRRIRPSSSLFHSLFDTPQQPHQSTVWRKFAGSSSLSVMVPVVRLAC